MKHKRIITLVISIVALLLIAFFILPVHMQRGLLYRKASIDDYKIFENRNVDAGAPVPWAVSPKCNAKEVPADAARLMTDLRTTAFLVIKDNKIIYEKYFKGYDRDAKSGSFSAAKSIVSILVGIALDEGKIKSLDEPVGNYIPEFSKGPASHLTIKDVLTMSSGIDWDESYSSLFSITTKYYFGNDTDGLVRGLKVIEIPGKRFNYQSGSTLILGQIVTKATGRKLAEYASEKLWRPLGAESPALWSLDRKDGIEKAFCCFNATARDFARIGQMVLNGGTFAGKRIVSAAYLRQATSPASWLVDDKGKPVDFYGYQFWIMYHRGLTIPMARGILGQYIMFIPRKNAVIVRLGEKRIEEKVRNVPRDAYTWVDAALAVMGENN
jgi:CubicO group peptidase (beta-lactamase class C family)